MIRRSAVIALLFSCWTVPAHAQEASVVAAARAVLSDLQAISFASNREYCGILGRNDEGQMVASAPRAGQRDSCRPRNPRSTDTLIASFHTHAAHDIGADSEVPSSNDLRADMEDGIDGFVATPGGRFWFIDGTRGVAHLICGPGCLPQDPNYDPAHAGPIASRYTLRDLEQREHY